MSKTYIGFDGQYEIDEQGNIVHQLLDQFGRATGMTRVYKSVKKIPNLIDREKIEYLIQIMNIYKFTGRV
ncbi:MULTISPECIES: hypothetical protein [Ignavibacterium]|jgi:predicted lipase|uniref:hypothetical protein n=1 Tax=Ignavibacterium TaxID=795750 RepID=UPI0025BC5484|nr:MULTISPECIES: hypothetical protein [Ignavibacterium]MBI5661084.1 hypothetical protein [Ignavibacterium album]